ncbi:MAG: cytochrome ubiquinol oxidase subunit I [Ignavibacteriae bacterium]|nr:MAG: cytochrome ubiquinol oxidase subunit I [Ignavibacteriota bacterium]
MDALFLARLQFAVITIYHFFFVPITLGLTIFVAILETMYVKTGNEKYKKMTKFWGKLFLINFSIGVVTGIVQEFQFGMNWSQYSRFMGDIFGVPLAIEALVAFFMESTFIGLWIFGWEKLSKKMHLATIWLVALGSNLSAFWILVANSFMQQPVGYKLANGRAELIDFPALLTNGHVWVQFPHVFFVGITTAAFFVLGISSWHILKKSENLFYYIDSFKIASIFGTIGIVVLLLQGHYQGQYMAKIQPMKMAAAEALWNTEDPAAFSFFTIGDEKKREDVFAIKVPGLLSFMTHNSFDGAVEGINDLQKEYEEKYGQGNYIPPVAISYWAFRIMVGSGSVMLLLALFALYKSSKNDLNLSPFILKIFFWSLFLPHIASTSGWIFTEVARQPWIVFGLLQTKHAVSNTVPAGNVLFSFIAYTIIYALLFIATIFLWKKYAKAGVKHNETEENNNIEIVINKA